MSYYQTIILLRLINKYILLCCLLCCLNIEAQLGTCKGNCGDIIFEENFGNGLGNRRLRSGTTTYNFSSRSPNDGFYAVTNYSKHYNWFDVKDHTPGDKNGRMLIVNASHSAGEFFRIPISGLCENASYEFSSWILNLVPSYSKQCNNVIPINVTFEIWNESNSSRLATGSTGAIKSTNSAKWRKYALVFKTKPGETSVILKIKNNGSGGCGNDLALDDIEFKPCGDNVAILDSANKSSIVLNSNTSVRSTILSANPDFSVFTNHYYQWQKSNDGVNWLDIKGETGTKCNIKFSPTKTYYRVRVAESRNNLDNSLCYSYSDFYKIRLNGNYKPPPKLKPVVPTRPRVTTIVPITSKGIAKMIPDIKLEKIKIIAPLKMIDKSKLPKTYKNVVIVKSSTEILTEKVWVEGVPGKFVQTGEIITKQGHPDGFIVVYETVYYRARYGFNSVKRKYVLK